MKDVWFLSGLPRSGSTVLASMLNQHPLIHATTTSPVADLVSMTIDNWPTISQAIKNPNPNQYGNIVNGIIKGAHTHVEKPIVLDKNRLWPRLAPFIQKTMGIKPKIVCTVRSIPDIIASYILLIERNHDQITFIDRDLIDLKLPINNKNRARILQERYIGHPYQSLSIGAKSGAADMLFLEYTDIVEQPQQTISKVCKFLNIETYNIDSGNLSPMDENDEFHGGIKGLHDVRPQLMKVSPPPQKVIGTELTEYYYNMKMEFWRK